MSFIRIQEFCAPPLSPKEFIFTQPSALEIFAKFPVCCRTLIDHVTLRVVGRFYDDKAREVDLGWYRYYKDQASENEFLKLTTVERCPYLWGGRDGLQSYCWLQIADFDVALRIWTKASEEEEAENLLFPSLQLMHLDLVNFTCNIPGPKFRFRHSIQEITPKLWIKY